MKPVPMVLARIGVVEQNVDVHMINSLNVELHLPVIIR